MMQPIMILSVSTTYKHTSNHLYNNADYLRIKGSVRLYADKWTRGVKISNVDLGMRNCFIASLFLFINKSAEYLKSEFRTPHSTFDPLLDALIRDFNIQP